MLIEQVRKLLPLDRLAYWVKERDAIRVSRSLKSPPPWTDDDILAIYRFCNVRRMDDKVSTWLYNSWYRPYKDHPNMLVAVTLARHLNRVETLSKVGFPKQWRPEEIKTVVRKIQAGGEKAFSAAYMVRGIGTADKIEMVVDKVCQPLVDSSPQLDTSSMQECVETLLPYWGFSSFMAGQVVADLRWALSGSWKDRNSWAPIGPGSKRGMNRVMGRETNKPLSQEQFLEELQQLKERCSTKLPSSVTSRMEMQDWQNCMCEYDKYSRALLGEGKPKQLYKGGV